MINLFLIAAGMITLAIGVIGIFLPVLPSTPFFILTAGLFLRSSPVLYGKLVSNKVAGAFIRERNNSYKPYLLTLAILIMWLAIILTSHYISGDPTLRIILYAAGTAGTFFKGKLILRYIKRRQ